MFVSDHDCWWTRRRECELSRRGTAIIGAGLPRAVLERAARHLGLELRIASSAASDDELNDEESVALGPWTGALHDGCFIGFDESTPRLTEALVIGAIGLHENYLGRRLDAGIVQVIVDQLRDDMVVRLRSFTGNQRLTMKSYAADAGWLSRLATRPVHLA